LEVQILLLLDLLLRLFGRDTILGEAGR